MINQDTVTRLANIALNILTLHHPVRTAVGIIVGLFLWFCTGAYPTFTIILGMETNTYARLTISTAGFIITQAKTIFDGLTGRGVSEEVQAILNTIDSSPMTQSQKRAKYLEVIEAQIVKLGKSSHEVAKDEGAASE